MSDPFRIFKNAPNRQATLKALWPELHDCLAGADEPLEERFRPCDMAVHRDEPSPRPRAVARLSRNGYAACAICVARAADRPGGWPLDLREHRR